MAHIAPLGPVYQAGTLSGNPLAMRAGLTMLNEISQPGFFEALGQRTASLVDGLRSAAKEVGCPLLPIRSEGCLGSFLLMKSRFRGTAK